MLLLLVCYDQLQCGCYCQLFLVCGCRLAYLTELKLSWSNVGRYGKIMINMLDHNELVATVPNCELGSRASISGCLDLAKTCLGFL